MNRPQKLRFAFVPPAILDVSYKNSAFAFITPVQTGGQEKNVHTAWGRFVNRPYETL